jgi:hypothetical protein
MTEVDFERVKCASALTSVQRLAQNTDSFCCGAILQLNPETSANNARRGRRTLLLCHEFFVLMTSRMSSP